MREAGKPKMILIGNYVPDRQESMQRFAKMLEAGFNSAGIKTEIWHPLVFFGKFLNPTKHVAGKWLGYIDKWIIFPVILKFRLLGKRSTPHYFHVCDHSNSPYLKHLPEKVTGITCHDVLAIKGALGHEETYCTPSRTGVILQKWILSNLVKANRLASVSLLTQQQLQELAGPVSGRTRSWTVIHNAFNAHFYRMDQQRAKSLLGRSGLDHSTPFILHVGSSHARKNRKMLVQMVHALGDRWKGNICFAGEAIDAELQALIDTFGLQERTMSIMGADHETMVALYSCCQAFIFPSFSEGFGWPLIEAQACGAPVIASNIQPMPEVSGGTAVHADPHDPESFAEAFINLQDPMFKAKIIEQGYENIKRFSAEGMIEQYLSLYHLGSAQTHEREISAA